MSAFINRSTARRPAQRRDENDGLMFKRIYNGMNTDDIPRPKNPNE